MATLPGNFTRVQNPLRAAPSPAARVRPGVLGNALNPLRPPAARQPEPRISCLFALPKEPEDATLTGGTRSLDRRLMALNLSAARSAVRPA